MIFLSHAPNAEDVPLWRALHGVALGRYLDWGTEPADGASITRAFYDRGWSGVSVRPAPLVAALAAARPRDTVLAVGDALAVDGTLHYLRVSAVGEEAAVLRALAWRRHQPWVLVVQGDAAEAEAAEAGYTFALFDGVSRFYLSPDHGGLLEALRAPANCTDGFISASGSALAGRVAALEAALVAAEARVEGSSRRLVDALLMAGVARDDIGRMAEEFVWLRGLLDEWKDTAARHGAESAWLRGVLEDARAGTDRVRTEMDGVRAELDSVRAEADARLRQLLGRTEEAASLRSRLVETEARLQAFAEAESRLAAELAAVRASTSWRVTAPLRRLRGGAPPPVIAQVPQPAIAAPSVAAAPTAAQAPGPEPGPEPDRTEPVQPTIVTEAPVVSADTPAIVPEANDHFTPVAAAPVRRGPVAVVHQFHAGSNAGDAITNSMVLIRGRLRAAGFRSEIYVLNRGAGLGEDIRLIDTLPDHDGYVLLLHHSMGFPGFDEILARPARKVLMYHNITPPGLLANVPRIERQARMGREQLAALQSEVAFALADSDFNAVELHRLGFPAVRTCPLLFDVEEMVRRAAGLRLQDGVFTVLFVGRVTPSKAQDALVDAFAAFRTRFGRPCRLVLVGALDADEHRFIAAIQARVEAAGLEAEVQLTGLVSDGELQDWYRQADLYVSLSQHEGFGVPLVEAMAHGISVVAWPTGAVPFTLGGAGTLLTARDPAHVAGAMLAAAETRDAAGAPVLERWALGRHLPVLMQALAAAGAIPPPDAEFERALAMNLRVAVCGHVAKTYSLAAVNRGLARTIEGQRPGSVRLVPVEGTPTTDLQEVPEADQPFVTALASRPRPDTGPELVLSGHYPLYVPADRGDLLAALFFWEESLVPAAMVGTLNESFGAVFAPSAFVSRALVDSGVAIPVLTIGQAPDLSRLAALDPARERAGPFTFLHVSSAFPRKGLDVLLAAWARAFTGADDVRLVIKTFPNPHNDAAAQVAALRAAHPDAAPIELIDADLGPDEMQALYEAASAAVLPTRGEGFNLPAAEAMAAGLPLIVTAHGGHLDFCTAETARLVTRSLAPSGSHLASALSLWADPDVDDLVAALREAKSGALARQAVAARAAIAVRTDAAAFTARLAGAAARLMLAPPPRPVRITWITSWNVRCGIAEYSRTLLEALPRPGLAEPVILADDRTPGHAAWRLGDAGSVDGLLAAALRADADVTVIQHQPMLLAWPSLARLLAGLAAAGKRAVVTLHNTAHLLEIEVADREATVQALGRCARVLVHTLADVRRLDALGVSATLFPHPAQAAAAADIRALPPDAAPVIGCTGFFLPDKGIDVLIRATARLRNRWPNIRLRLVNAEYDHPLSAQAIAACRDLAQAEGLPVEWHTDFIPLEDQQALLRGCDVIALPYQHSKEGSSAALRSALATGIPVAVTPLPLFDEAAGAVFRLPGVGVAPVELGLANLLAHKDRRSALVGSARDWMAARALPGVAVRLAGMLRGLAAQDWAGQEADGGLW